jgi:glycosyltransferase involved in cell wall biosynthesis
LKNLPLVSVLIPYYNGKQHIVDAIKSIINQTFQDFEILVLDDGSKVSIEKTILDFQDDRIRYIRQVNVGLCMNINRSLELANGKYVARLDQDDISEPTRLEKQILVFQNNPDVDCVFTRINKFGGKRILSRKNKVIDSNKVFKFNPWRDGCQVNSTMMVKKDVLIALGGYRQEYYPSDDWDIELRMCQQYKVLVIDEPLVSYRFHALANTYRTFKSMQNKRRWAEENYNRRAEGKAEISFNVFQHAADSNLWTKFRHYCKDNSKLNLRIAAGFFLDGHNFRAIKHLLFSFLFHPLTYLKRFLLINKVGQ